MAAGPAWLVERPVAHRGLHDRAAGIIENSLAAVTAAADAGYSIEIDVRPAADGIPVVFHDDRLERLTGGTGPVGARTAAELGRIELTGTSSTIPVLSDVLRTLAGRAPLFVEVKSDGSGVPALCSAVAEVLSAYNGPVAVMSFDTRAVCAFRRLAPRLVRGVVARARPPFPDKGVLSGLCARHLLHLAGTRPHFLAYNADDLPAAAPIAARGLLGVPLLAWTVRDAAGAKRARRWADEIIFEGFRP